MGKEIDFVLNGEGSLKGFLKMNKRDSLDIL